MDMDGTLIDSEKVWDRSLDELMGRLGAGPLSTGARQESIGGSLWSSVRICFREAGRDPSTVPEAEMAAAGEWLFTRTGELFGEGLPWRPGARELLGSLRAAGVPAALVTNTIRSLVELALDTLGRENFAATVCGDEVGLPKPAPDPYLRAADLLGLDPARCLAVEDSPTGAVSAEDAGCVVLVVPCEIPVPGGPRRVHRESLTGVTLSDLARIHASVMSPAPP
ncbi:HAD family hydrolase [Pseudonocardia sp. KRD291]|uniref:HAD family hydrolase n=1 Tax=Pseudonocardia sp. KRD291 TaxID=2792007 RepID=UPI0035B1B8BE